MARIYLGMRGGLLIADEDSPQIGAVHFQGSDISQVAIDPANPKRIYAGLYSGQEVYGRPDAATKNGLRGLWRSDDGGESWTDVSAGLTHPAITAVAVRREPGGLGTLLAGSEPSALSVSEDDGETWRPAGELTTLSSAPTWAFPPRPYTHHVRWIELDPSENDRLFLCIEAGALIQSRDGGRTWHDRAPDGPFDTHTLATHPLAPGRLYAAAGDGFLRAGDGYAESRDRGQTWARIGDGLQHHYLYGLAVDSANPDTILISASSSAMQAHDPTNAESFVYRREAGGPWELAMDGLPSAQGMTIPIFTAHPTQGGRFYAASNQGVFRSLDAGRTWEQLPFPWPPEYQYQNARSIALVG